MSRSDDSAAVLCSGPSLQETWLGPRGDANRPDPTAYVIGVNRAVEAWPCDWWAFNDHETFLWRQSGLRGHPACCTSEQAVTLIRKAGHGELADRFIWRTYPQLATTCPANAHWTNWSMLVGLVLAESLGAKRIRLYGCDQHGINDWDGPSPTRAIRSEWRWKNERHDMDRVVHWLSERGVILDVVRPSIEACA